MKKTFIKTHASQYRIGILVSRFNSEITGRLLKLCLDELYKKGVQAKRIQVIWVPGAYEIPFMAQKMAKTGRLDAVICLGCVIKGQTSHDVYISNWASIGAGLVSLNTGVPVLFGVLTPNSEAQALKRASRGPFNRGKEVASAALEMIELNEKVRYQNGR